MSGAPSARASALPVDPMFLERWSPRAFTGEAIPDDVLMTCFEAAHWAPSAFNGQPWRFIYAKNDGPAWATFLNLLIPYNQQWAHTASALVFIASDRLRRSPTAEPAPNYSHTFDTGTAWGYFAMQAHLLGWAAHGMTGFEVDRAYETLGVPEEEYRLEAAVAIGRRGDKSAIPESFHPRETPNTRRPVGELVFEGGFTAK